MISRAWVSLSLATIVSTTPGALASRAVAQPNYIAVRIGLAGQDVLELRGVGDGQQVGNYYAPGAAGSQAVLATGTSASQVALTPGTYSYSSAYDTAAGQQVGTVQLTSSGPLRAALWQGSAQSFVELHPAWANGSRAWATDGAQQVGTIDDYAALWTGSAASAVVLHPSGFASSSATAVFQGMQAGYGYLANSGDHALLWRGSASSVVDLNPAGYSSSRVYGLGDGYQVGIGTRLTDGAVRLLVWHGTADSVTDVTPNGFTGPLATVYDGGGPFIAGDGRLSESSPSHAYVWSMSGEAVDLQTAIPDCDSKWSSGARGVDSLGNAVGNLVKPGTGSDAVLWWRAGELNPSSFTVGTDTYSKSITIDAAKSMNISSILTVAEGGLLALDGANITAGTARIKTGATLSGRGNLQGAIVGESASNIVATGDLSLGNANAFGSFDTSGSLAVGSAMVTINGKGFATLGSLTTLGGGTLVASGGISLGPGRNLLGAGVVNAKVASGVGSTIVATGTLTLGSAGSPVGFTSDGELYTGANIVNIHDANEAVLGSLTKLGTANATGTLTAANANVSDTHAHFLLEEGKNLAGRGTINGHFKNHGHVTGDGTRSGERIVFSSPWTVSGDGTFENTLVLGTFAPGNSPGIVSGASQGFGGTIVIELGGGTPGFGDGHHDQINDSSVIRLDGAPMLSIAPWNGFVPLQGQQFEIMTWGIGLDGTFGSVQIDPWFLSHGFTFDVAYDNVNGAGDITITAVPEPSTWALIGTGIAAVVLSRFRRLFGLATTLGIRVDTAEHANLQ